jgi:hypothetical protein
VWAVVLALLGAAFATQAWVWWAGDVPSTVLVALDAHPAWFAPQLAAAVVAVLGMVVDGRSWAARLGCLAIPTAAVAALLLAGVLLTEELPPGPVAGPTDDMNAAEGCGSMVFVVAVVIVVAFVGALFAVSVPLLIVPAVWWVGAATGLVIDWLRARP